MSKARSSGAPKRDPLEVVKNISSAKQRKLHHNDADDGGLSGDVDDFCQGSIVRVKLLNFL